MQQELKTTQRDLSKLDSFKRSILQSIRDLMTSPLAVRMSTKSTLRLVSSSAAESSSEIAADVNKLGEEDVPGYLVVLVDDAMAPYKTGVRLPVDETHLHLTDVRCIDNPYAYISAVLNPSRGFLRQALRAV